MFSEIVGPDLLVVAIVVVLLLFGGSFVPKLARNLGSAKTEFEQGLKSSRGDDPSSSAPAQSKDVEPGA